MSEHETIKQIESLARKIESEYPEASAILFTLVGTMKLDDKKIMNLLMNLNVDFARHQKHILTIRLKQSNN